jgi:hypothetical protein
MRRLLFITSLVTAALASAVSAAPAGAYKVKMATQTRSGSAGAARASNGCHAYPNGLRRHDLLFDCKDGRSAAAVYTFTLPDNVASTVQPHVSLDILRDGRHFDYALIPLDRRHVTVSVSARDDARVDVRQVSISYYVRV